LKNEKTAALMNTFIKKKGTAETYINKRTIKIIIKFRNIITIKLIHLHTKHKLFL